jgi:DivIVA domain-containing protein
VAVIWLWVVVAVVVIGAVAVIVAGRDDEMAEVYDDRPDVPFPTGRPLASADLDQLRFSTGFRGYRMDEVDAFVDRIKADLISRETTSADDTTASVPTSPGEADQRADREDDESAAPPATDDEVEQTEESAERGGDDVSSDHDRQGT